MRTPTLHCSPQGLIQPVKTRSILPNSSPEILLPIDFAGGILQVVWIIQIDAHGLFFTRAASGNPVLFATHHNGYSCHELAQRLKAGNWERAVVQLEFIRDCGGTGITAKFIEQFKA